MRDTNSLRCSITSQKNLSESSSKIPGIRTLLGLVLAVQDRKLSEDTHMRPLQAEAGFEEADDFLKVTAALIHRDEGTELLSMDDDVKTTDLSLERF